MNTIATTSTVTPSTQNPKQPQQRQTAKEIIAANVKEPYRAVGGRTQRRAHRLPRRHEPLSQLQLWQHPGNRTAEAGRNPRCWPVRMEPAWPQGEEGREGHPHSCSHHRHSSARRTRKPRKTSPSRTSASWLASAMPMSSMSRRPKARSFPPCARCRGDVGENRDRLVSFIERQGIELVFTENIAPALGMSYGGQDRHSPRTVGGRGVLHACP